MARISLKQKIKRQISRCWKRNVFVRDDFAHFGGYDQVGRALLELTREGTLLRIGYGLYAKARKNKLTGRPMLACDGGFNEVAREALDLLGVQWSCSELEEKYNANLSTQVPINPIINIKGRFSRKIFKDNMALQV